MLSDLRDMPSKYEWETFSSWGHKYGPLVYLSVFGQPILIINSQEAATDLLEKRAAIYSDRPRLVMAVELSGNHIARFLPLLLHWSPIPFFVGFSFSTVLMRHGSIHKMFRKLLSQALHPRVVQQDFAPLQERLTRHLVKALLDDPDNFVRHIHQCVVGLTQRFKLGSDDKIRSIS